MVLRYAFPAGSADADVEQLVPKLIELAKKADDTISNADPLTFG